jgi:hypothetical protein
VGPLGKEEEVLGINNGGSSGRQKASGFSPTQQLRISIDRSPRNDQPGHGIERIVFDHAENSTRLE